jgi:hypothetical protein
VELGVEPVAHHLDLKEVKWASRMLWNRVARFFSVQRYQILKKIPN